MSVNLEIVCLESSEHLIDAKWLLQEYANSRPNDPALTKFPAEIAQLPGEYAPPKGCFLLGYFENEPIGCVAIHKWSERIAEMKRLYVRPQKRGAGFGKKLIESIVEQAKTLGYDRMYLDTIPSMVKAQALYRMMGFTEIPAYRYNPNQGTLFFELKLND